MALWRLLSRGRSAAPRVDDEDCRSLAEQSLLEELLEATKPPVPPACRELHYLLNTPFRYGAPYPTGSRFRRAGFTPGVYYASTAAATAIGELTCHRLLFFADSPGTPWPRAAGEYTVFSVRFRTTAGVDLTAPPLSKDAERWSHPVDYRNCQDLAECARDAGLAAIQYASARVPDGVNLALLTCGAFASRQPATRQTWRVHFGVTAFGPYATIPRRGWSSTVAPLPPIRELRGSTGRAGRTSPGPRTPPTCQKRNSRHASSKKAPYVSSRCRSIRGRSSARFARRSR